MEAAVAREAERAQNGLGRSMWQWLVLLWVRSGRPGREMRGYEAVELGRAVD